ncbi:hypothetical protein [Vibrio crassostreae]|nr:hypothetical protein [Vibrio crassostreae]CAK2501775.1 hypothetical protein VCRA2114E121_450008 [Vibrio crassostreae]CAK3455678.1 hypothetical protein VCRA2126E132_430009 [Vibrio crassostreae]CDT73296.1 conserved hypothetical protein [Vibrio crassostreae]
MPLIVLLPLLAGGAGFAGGFFTGQSLSDWIKIGVILAVSFWLFLKIKRV